MNRAAGLLLSCFMLAISGWLAGCECRNGSSGIYPSLRCSDGDDDYSPRPRLCTAITRSCNGPPNDEDGCETFVDESTRHCGECDVVCPGGEEATCVGGVCALSCEEGRTECDGACTDLLSDAANCGQCGEVCGTECREGVCLQEALLVSSDPVSWLHCAEGRLLWNDYQRILTASIDDFQPAWLVSLDGNGFHVAGDKLYMEDFDVLFSIPIAGGPITEIDTGEYIGSAIGANETSLYWMNTGHLQRMPLGGGPIEVLFDPPSPPNTGIDVLEVSSTALYLGLIEYGKGGDNYLLRAPLSDPSALSPFGPSFGDEFPFILLHGDSVLAVFEEASGRRIARLDAGGADPVTLVSASAEARIHGVEGDLLLWSDQDRLYELDLAKAGATPVERVHHPGGINDACLMGDTLYFGGKDNTIRRVIRTETP